MVSWRFESVPGRFLICDLIITKRDLLLLSVITGLELFRPDSDLYRTSSASMKVRFFLPQKEEFKCWVNADVWVFNVRLEGSCPRTEDSGQALRCTGELQQVPTRQTEKKLSHREIIRAGSLPQTLDFMMVVVICGWGRTGAEDKETLAGWVCVCV